MANRTAKLTHPTTRADGAAFPIGELKHVVLEIRANAAGTVFTAVGAPMLPTELSRVISNLADGTSWIARAMWVDTANRSSLPLEVPFSIPVATIANPGQGTLTITT